MKATRLLSCAWLLISLATTSCRSVGDAPVKPQPTKAAPPMEDLELEGTIGFKVRLRWMVLEADAPMTKLAKLVARNNLKEKSSTIDDSINSGLVDMAKVQAFLHALARVPDEQKKELAKAAIYLSDETLLLETASPTTPASFQGMTGIKDLVVDGPVVKLTPIVPVDEALARATIARSKAAIATLNERIATLEAVKDPDGKVLGELGDTKRARFKIAGVWRFNARVLAAQITDPKAQAAANAERDEAARMASKYIVLVGGGMPSDDETAPL